MDYNSLSIDDCYKILQDNAKKLESNNSVSIDELLKLVEESSLVYNTCKSKLEKVKKTIEEMLKDDTGTKQETSDEKDNNENKEDFNKLDE